MDADKTKKYIHKEMLENLLQRPTKQVTKFLNPEDFISMTPDEANRLMLLLSMGTGIVSIPATDLNNLFGNNYRRVIEQAGCRPQQPSESSEYMTEFKDVRCSYTKGKKIGSWVVPFSTDVSYVPESHSSAYARHCYERVVAYIGGRNSLLTKSMQSVSMYELAAMKRMRLDRALYNSLSAEREFSDNKMASDRYVAFLLDKGLVPDRVFTDKRGRVYHPLTQVSSLFTECLTIDGRPVVQFDLSSSQLIGVAALTRASNYGADEALERHLADGTVYDNLVTKTGMDRDYVKKLLLQSLFGYNKFIKADKYKFKNAKRPRKGYTQSAIDFVVSRENVVDAFCECYPNAAMFVNDYINSMNDAIYADADLMKKQGAGHLTAVADARYNYDRKLCCFVTMLETATLRPVADMLAASGHTVSTKLDAVIVGQDSATAAEQAFAEVTKDFVVPVCVKVQTAGKSHKKTVSAVQQASAPMTAKDAETLCVRLDTGVRNRASI